jgi:hypothetical protein
MLAGSPSAILTMGLGSWGSPGLMLTLGYGVGEQGATLVGRWSNVITARAFTGPIIVSANTGPITARAETKVEL